MSTSTGIPDFRSSMDTVLPTGPGVWELRDYSKNIFRPKKAMVLDDMQKAIPSLCHMYIL